MRLFPFLKKTNTLYFPGCTTYFKHPEKFNLYKKIFKKLKINFTTIDKQTCCGLELLEAGYETEARNLIKNNFQLFKEEDIEEIITTSPECYKTFLQDYSEILFDWDIKVKNIWDLIIEKLERKPRLIKHKAMETITFHDNCYLGRHLWIYQTPRRILELIGYEIKEMSDNKESSLCCGSCGGLPRTNPELADKIAKERILQAKRIGVKKLIVCSLDNYQLLKKNSEELEILELSEVLAEALGIIHSEKDEEYISDEERIFEEVKSNKRFAEELDDEDMYYQEIGDIKDE